MIGEFPTRWVVVLACTLLVASPLASSAYASGSFGIESYGLTATEENSSVDTQAGSHPYELTAEAALDPNAHNTSGEEVRSLDFELPPGLIINPANIPQNDAVGMAQVGLKGKTVPAVVYNMAPAPGELAQFGFTIEDLGPMVDVSVGVGSDHGMALSLQDLPRGEIESVKLTLGRPSSPTLLTLPTSCTGSPQTTLQGESWGGEKASLSASVPQMNGCDRLPFDPSLNVVPEVTEAGQPSGYQVQLSVPKDESQGVLATAQMRDASVMLPAGTSLSPSAADGLEACSEAEVGLGLSSPDMCPQSATVGAVEIQTPLLASPLDGHLYLASPNANPFGSLLPFYLVAEDSEVSIKLTGEVDANPTTGQLTVVLHELPQLPISELNLHFRGGARALLVNSPECGLATSVGELTPWSGDLPASSSSSFEISSGVDGTPCSTTQPFNPVIQAKPPVSVPAEDGAPSSTGSVSLVDTRVVTTRAGEATIKLACAGTATCSGRLTLTAKRQTKGKKQLAKAQAVGTAAFSIPPGKTETIKLKLNGTGRALLSAAHGRLDASLVTLKSSPAPSHTHTENVRLVQQKAQGKTKKPKRER